MKSNKKKSIKFVYISETNMKILRNFKTLLYFVKKNQCASWNKQGC